MSNQSPSTNAQNETSSNSASEVKDWREMRREERANRRAERREMRGSHAYGWMGGLILIVIGGAVLVQNLTGIHLLNWWALFILIPAVGAFASAWNIYQKNGRLTSGGRGSLIGGFILAIISAAFLFNLDLGNFWPVLLILAGLAVVTNALLPG
jgi:hypothetical protein